MHIQPVSKALILALACGAFSAGALAQWQWIDKDGRKVYSDRSPPPDIQEKNILKRPGGPGALPAVAPAAATSAAAGAAAAKASAPQLSGKDAALEAKKKKAEDDEAAAKKADEERVARAKADNCERARKGLQAVQSGQRMATTNAKGEREIMDDKARADETSRLQAVVGSDCK